MTAAVTQADDEVQPTTANVATAWMTVDQAATHAIRHPQTIYKALRLYVHSGHKRGLRGSQTGAGGTWRIRPADLEAWMDGEAPKRRRPS